MLTHITIDEDGNVVFCFDNDEQMTVHDFPEYDATRVAMQKIVDAIKEIQ